MIKLFRNIRKNLLQTSSTGKYLKYAIGEIVLVVIGILIALQVNDWNEHRKQAVQEQFLLAKLKTDLNSDIKILTLAISGTEDRIREYKFCLDVLAGKTVGTIIDFKNNFHSILTLYRFNKNKTTFNNLVESGKIELIKNQTLLDSIVSYYNDESHKGFDNAMEEYTRNTIGPFLFQFDYIPRVNYDKFNNMVSSNRYYTNIDISQFEVKSKSLHDYKKSIYIINILRQKLWMVEGQKMHYQNLLKNMKTLETKINNEIKR